MIDGLTALRAGPLHNPVPQTWTEPADYTCNECGHKDETTIEMETGGTAWWDAYCDECGSDDLEMGVR